ncbi:SPOR domain-containing protein [Paenibacillus flagellatus]|uniref:SPOR domain-containing protein n=1 Tax=Paenibacillus flagellatus TaxID=2211139 RepID=A0A2V5JZ52_9BACL|nr:SPOR domain-containing protein [Paenibacillus flagellatus]PYI52219.1 hypothetical protein DLM86_22370 [Paenibacillus flagellatus]
MNKARITYRFDETGREAARKEPNPVIPLTQEEFTVIEDVQPIRTEERPHRAEEPEEHEAWSERDFSRGRSRDIIDVQPLNQFTTDFGAWSSPFDAETERVERAIRESGGARAPERDERPAQPPIRPVPHQPYPIEPQERYDGESGYYGTDERDVPYRRRGDVQPFVGRSRYERHNRTPWLKIVTSVAGAVGTGVLIGYFVLSMFGGDETLPGTGATAGAGKPPAAANGSPAAGQTKPPAAEAAPASSTSAATVAVNVAAQSYTLLQNGVFSNQQGADAAAAELKKQGLAAFVQPSDKFYVYVGMAPSRDDALALSQLLQAKEPKTELFLKAVSMPAVAKIKWSGTAEQAGQAETFLVQSRKLVQTIGSFAAARLKEATPGAMDDATLATIKTAHQAMSGAAAPFAAGLAQEQKATLERLGTAMSTAVASMDEYKKNASASYLWQAQTALMQAAFAESELLAAIKAP